jgi:GMP synthase (glutamine-hydrolysing)
MPKHAAMILHHPESTDNRIADLLIERGYQIDWYCPREGDSLPEDPESLAAVVFLGGAMSANDDHEQAYLRTEYQWIEQVLGANRPFLGICLGAQMLARIVGGQVAPHQQEMTQVGYYPITSTPEGQSIFGDHFHAFHWHREGITLPSDIEVLATTETYPVQAFKLKNSVYGLQFHPEVTRVIFEHWIQEVPHCCEWPGAQSPEQMRQGWKHHDGVIHQQTSQFVDHWLNESQ